MPSVKDQGTAEAIAREYCSNGRNKEGAMRTIGYAESSCKSGKAVGDVYGNLRVKEAILKIEAELELEQGRTVQSLDKMYQSGFDVAKKQGNPTGMATNTTGIARLYGMDKDNDGKSGQEQELTQAQAREARGLLYLRNKYADEFNAYLSAQDACEGGPETAKETA